MGVALAGLEAYHLVHALFSICAMTVEWSDADRAIVKKLRREVDEAIQMRNRVAHDVLDGRLGQREHDGLDHGGPAASRGGETGLRHPNDRADRRRYRPARGGRERKLLYFLAGLCHPVMRESAPNRTPARLLMVDADGRVQAEGRPPTSPDERSTTRGGVSTANRRTLHAAHGHSL